MWERGQNFQKNLNYDIARGGGCYYITRTVIRMKGTCIFSKAVLAKDVVKHADYCIWSTTPPRKL